VSGPSHRPHVWRGPLGAAIVGLCVFAAGAALGQAASYGYDDHGRVLSLDFGDPTATSLTYTYDANGNRQTLTATFTATAAPLAETGDTQAATSTGVTLTGWAAANGAAAQVWFEWGPTEALGSSTTPQALVELDQGVPAQAALSALAAGNSGYYRLAASSSVGTTVGELRPFTLLGPGAADLGVVQSGLVDPAIVGAHSWTVTVTNDGPDSATDVVVEISQAGVAAILGATVDGADCALTLSGARCELGPLTASQAALISVSAISAAPGWAYPSANASAAEADAEPGDNSVTGVFAVNAVDTDDDGVADQHDLDDDDDGLPDSWELAHQLNPLVADADADADRDGYTNREEYDGNSDPQDATSRPDALFLCGWEWANPQPLGADLAAVAHGEGVTVAVGEAVGLWTRLQTGEWRQAHVPFTNQGLKDVAYGAGRFVAVGNNTLLSSDDGLVWDKDVGLPDLTDVAYGAGQFVAITPGGSVWNFHADGSVTFSQLDAGISLQHGRDIFWDGARFIVVTTRFVMASPDADSWEVLYDHPGGAGFDPADATDPMRVGAYNGTTYLIGTGDGNVVLSDDGVVWNVFDAGLGNLANDSAMRAFTWTGQRWVGVGSNQGVEYVSTSETGIGWELQSLAKTRGLQDVVWTGSEALAVGDRGAVLVSADGTAWAEEVATLRFDLHDVTATASRFVAVGDEATLLRSFDGGRWETVPVPTTEDLLATAASDARVVVAGAAETVLVSADTASWTLLESGPGVTMTALTWTGTEFLGVGGSVVARSPDGLSWTTETPDPAMTLRDVASDGTTHIVVGSSPDAGPSILVSAEGAPWTVAYSSPGMIGAGWALGAFYAWPEVVSQMNLGRTSVDGVSWGSFGQLRDYAAIVAGPGRRLAIQPTGTVRVSTHSHVSFGAESDLAIREAPFIKAAAIRSSDLVAVGDDGAILRAATSCSHLALAFGLIPQRMVAGEDTRFLWTLTNRGPVYASEVGFKMEVPLSVTVVDVPGSLGCTREGTWLQCSLPDLPAREQLTLELVVNATPSFGPGESSVWVAFGVLEVTSRETYRLGKWVRLGLGNREVIITDLDDDGVPLDDDNCPATANADQGDADDDDIGDACEDDDDDDGLPDAYELAHGLDPLDPADATQDPDEDGFDTLTERGAGTDPRDGESHPALGLDDVFEWVNPTPSGARLEFAAASERGLLLMSLDGNTLRSRDGVRWRPGHVGLTQRLFGPLTRQGDHFVIRGAEGASGNGPASYWLSRGGDAWTSIPEDGMRELVWFGDTWVGLRSSYDADLGRFVYELRHSVDLSHWTSHSLGTAVTNASRLVAGPAGLVIVITDEGGTTRTAVSPDGIQWTHSAAAFTGRANTLVATPAGYLALDFVVDGTARAQSSTDGLVWSLVDTGLTFFPAKLFADGETLTVLSSSVEVATATDPTGPWTVSTLPDGARGTEAAWSPDAGWVVTNGGGETFASADATAWSAVLSGESARQTIIAHGGGRLVAAEARVVLATSDGVTWAREEAGLPADHDIGGLLWDGSQFIGASPQGLFTSPATTPLSWTRRAQGPLPPPKVFQVTPNRAQLAYHDGVYVAVNNEEIWSSRDLVTWTYRSSYDGYDVIWGDSEFIVVGASNSGGSRGAQRSADGESWSFAAQFSTDGPRRVVWTGSQYVGLGSLGVWTSFDASTWGYTPIEGATFLTDMAWSGGDLLAIAQGSAWSTRNFSEWFQVPFAPVPASGFDVVWDGDRFYVVGPTGIVRSGPNTPPSLDAIADVTVTEGDTVSFAIVADDIDGHVPVISVLRPDTATLVAHGDGAATWTWVPGLPAVIEGAVAVAISASDTFALAEQTVTVTVLADCSLGGAERAGRPCDDGDVCTLNDRCAGTVCTGEAVACPSPGQCLPAGSCDSTSGACVYPPVTPGVGESCDDGDPCTPQDICTDGVCVVVQDAPASDCDDGIACTVDSCSAATGDPVTGCLHTPQDTACDDGVACTLDQCDPAQGCAHLTNDSDCADVDACTDDACTPGGCVSTPSVCDDGNLCTLDSCEADTGCQSVFDAGACHDDNPCTADGCDVAANACTHEDAAGSCTDDDACTGPDACEGGACLGADLDCDDQNRCTADSCDVILGCQHAPTGGDCDDANPCTADSCDIASGNCVHTPNALGCDDGDVCTAGDVCSGGTCQGSQALCDVLGDLAGADGCVDIADAVVARAIVDGTLTPAPWQRVVGDVAPVGAPNGVVDEDDVEALLDAAVGLIDIGATPCF
jgi:hypothetical protein